MKFLFHKTYSRNLQFSLLGSSSEDRNIERIPNILSLFCVFPLYLKKH